MSLQSVRQLTGVGTRLTAASATNYQQQTRGRARGRPARLIHHRRPPAREIHTSGHAPPGTVTDEWLGGRVSSTFHAQQTPDIHIRLCEDPQSTYRFDLPMDDSYTLQDSASPLHVECSKDKCNMSSWHQLRIQRYSTLEASLCDQAGLTVNCCIIKIKKKQLNSSHMST